MSAKVSIYDPLTGDTIATQDIFNETFKGLQGKQERVVEVIDAIKVHGTFASVTRTGSGTSLLVSPTDDGSLVLTDLLISGEKQTGSSITVQFTDGTETVPIFSASQVDAPPNFAHTFGGRFQGWKNARIDVVTTGTADATVTLGYLKVPVGLDYSVWDSFR